MIGAIVALEFPEGPAGSLKLAPLLALGFILFVISFIVLASILVTLLVHGARGLGLHIFTITTKPPGSHGGLLNAFVAALIQTGVGTLIGATHTAQLDGESSACWSS